MNRLPNRIEPGDLEVEAMGELFRSGDMTRLLILADYLEVDTPPPRLSES